MHHLRQYPWLQKHSLPGVFDRLRVQFLLLQKQKLWRLFASSMLAYTQLKKETGLLHLHLNPTPDALHVQVVDKLGITHHVDLKNTPFVLQRRASNAFKTLKAHIKQRDIPHAKEVINNILHCLNTRYAQGIRDHDPALRRNIGLFQDRAIFIDIGSFAAIQTPFSNTPFSPQEERLRDTRRMRKWLHKRSPELTQYFDSLVQMKAPPQD